MRMRWVAVTTLLAVSCAGGKATRDAPKYLIILQADTDRHEGMARALHALLYAKELKEAGYAVTLIFDGAGTAWAKAMRDPANRMHAKYEELKALGVVDVICDFCAGAFKVKDDLKKSPGANLVGDVDGHPSLKRWVAEGYQVIVL